MLKKVFADSAKNIRENNFYPILRKRFEKNIYFIYSETSFRGHSSAGRALRWHRRGQEFDPPWLHQNLKEKGRVAQRESTTLTS